MHKFTETEIMYTSKTLTPSMVETNLRNTRTVKIYAEQSNAGNFWNLKK